LAKYTKNCENCGDPFPAERATAKYCGDPCRVAAGRKKKAGAITPQAETPQESQENMDSNSTIAYQHAECDAFILAGKSSEACEGCRGEKKSSEAEPPTIQVPDSMKDRMAAIRERMNARLRAKGLPLISEHPEVMHFVPTGIGELDALTAGFDLKGSGGLPRKKITEIYGPKGVGKSSLVKTIMKMNPDLKVLFFDAEGGMVGPPENMQIVKGNVVEEIMPLLLDAVESQEYDLIIVDSIASLITRKQYEGDPEGKAAMARSFGPYVKQLVAYLQPLKDGLPDPAPGTAVVFINQFRSTTQAFGVQEYTVGGKSMEYYASLRLCFRSATTDHIIRNGKIAGQRVRVKVEKTRFGPKLEEFTFPIMFDELRAANENYMDIIRKAGLE
jgi:RecA/RadA recombinase